MVRGLWAALHEAGLPSRGDHVAESNRPHVTLAASHRIDAAGLTAAGRLKNRLPYVARVSGLHLMQPAQIAYLAVDFDEWRSDVERLQHLIDDPRAGNPWLPHVTISGRLTDAQVQQLREVPLDVPSVLAFDAITHWDPGTRRVAVL